MHTTLKAIAASALIAIPALAQANEASVVAIATHPVEDYATWRAVYDSFEDAQMSGGVLQEAVFRDVAEPNVVTILHYFDSVADATNFFSSEDLKKAMMDAGVSAKPVVRYAHTTD